MPTATTRKGGIKDSNGVLDSTNKQTYGENSLIGCTQTSPITWPSEDNLPHDESKWDLKPLPDVVNFRSSVVLKDSTTSNQHIGRCALPSDRIDGAISFDFEYEHDDPSFFKLYLYATHEAYKEEQPATTTTASTTPIQNVQVIEIEGSKRNIEIRFKDVLGLALNTTIWSDIIYAKMVAVAQKRMGVFVDKRRVSNNNATLNGNGESASVTATQCSVINKLINETDCDPTMWKCMVCPKQGAMCGAGNGLMCSLASKQDNPESCSFSRSTCQECGGTWWGGNDVFDWIQAVPGYWRNFTAWRAKIKDKNKWVNLENMRKCQSKFHCPAGRNINGKFYSNPHANHVTALLTKKY